MTQLVLQISIGELTHDGNVVLEQQRGFLPTLLQNTHRLCQRAAMETDPIDAQQSITRLDRSFSEGLGKGWERERVSTSALEAQKASGNAEVGGHSPVSWTARPDVCNDNGTRLVPVFMSAACTHARARTHVS